MWGASLEFIPYFSQNPYRWRTRLSHSHETNHHEHRQPSLCLLPVLRREGLRKRRRAAGTILVWHCFRLTRERMQKESGLRGNRHGQTPQGTWPQSRLSKHPNTLRNGISFDDILNRVPATKTQQNSIDLQPRDHALLRGLFECRVMTTDHAAGLYFDSRNEAAKKRLQS